MWISEVRYCESERSNTEGKQMRHANPTDTCEAILHAEIRYNTEHQILPSECLIAHRMLARRLELVNAYAEVVKKLGPHTNALESFLKAILYTSAFWSPEKLEDARRGRERLNAVNAAISAKASELATLLDQRSELHNKSQFHSDTHYDVCDVIIEAAASNYRFNSFVKSEFSVLSGQFDLKYWPTLGEFARVLSHDASTAVSQASDRLTAVGTIASRPSLADYFRALFAAMDDNGAAQQGFIPTDLRSATEHWRHSQIALSTLASTIRSTAPT
ncbi:hypothetical protein [Rhizobium sp. CG5]|uniref:hypothetical protein n=1 Tax=Rhizobium sp. CG5 TaxID=2726076 RepID=UPI002034303C|nr:hypothetical protein [Rhizobium sp. CG5]